mgnify:CR=1 FL=1
MSMRLTGALMTLCALVACGEGRQVSLATSVLSYNGSNPFPAVIGASMALTPAVSGTPKQAGGRGVLRQRPLTGAARSIPGRSTRLGMRRWTPS